MKRVAMLLILLAGCYDSLVSDRCLPGLVWNGGACVPADPNGGGDGPLPDAFTVNGDGAGGEGADARPTDARPTPDASSAPDASASPDATTVADAAGPPDALVCTPPLVACGAECVDLQTDPDHCGACDISCASGLCEAGLCLGALSGHVVLIGHDYVAHHTPAVRLLGDAVGLGTGNPLGVGIWQGSANPQVATAARDALDQGMAATGRMWSPTDLGATPFADLRGIGTVVVLPQRATDGGVALAANGAAWSQDIHAFLARGGVIVVLEGEQDVSYELLVGAGEITIGTPHKATGDTLTVAAPGDPCAVGVLSPYHADATTVGWDGLVGDVAVVTDPAGTAVVVHGTR